ncbi:MAG: glutamine-hydrolyzing carbamoyl-phosphate synthase small subunit [Clostridia bacterium]|nr:glutamine-hydrolyzing carbamoyl-phosphate synthase small subunit [Clostridia bacterium]
MENKRYLLLEDGTVMQGVGFGATGDVVGELVFNTSMVGYMETLTDPSYFGQIVVQTFPAIGNYGVMLSDTESEVPALHGYIVREWCQEPSNFRCEGVLDTFLKEKNVVGISGIDTRALTRKLRDNGSMNAMITDDPTVTDARLQALRDYRITGAVSAVSPKTQTHLTAPNADKTVVLWNFGARAQIARNLLQYGYNVTVVPADTTAEEILALKPDGILLSDGPGDPAENTAIIAEIQKLLDKQIPMLGICLGHQLLALAYGAETAKLPYGHRGSNQPAVYTETGHAYITAQNHGYTVVGDTLPAGCKISFVNANDGTCEGIDYPGGKIRSVQFLPDAFGSKLTTSFVYEQFLDLLK